MENQPVFLQIAEGVADRILRGELQPDAQVPSVRELAATLQVNPNTVMRAFERLAADGLVYNRRGLGYFVALEARDRVLAIRRARLLNDTLPALAQELRLLGVTPQEAGDILSGLLASNT